LTLINSVKQHKRTLINKYAKADNVKGLTQVFTTLVPLAVLWGVLVPSARLSYWLVAGVTLLMSLFLLRVFVLMHECGHGSLFCNERLNNAFGFVFGVVSGMPQYVWSQHHAYHHATNGNWNKYRGPLTTQTIEEFQAMTTAQQRKYQRARNIWIAPFGGFLYLIFNPRITWLKGTVSLVSHIVKRKIAEPRISIRTHAAQFKTPYWTDAKQYWHMFWNNLVLLSIWVVMASIVGPVLFFTVYLISLSFAGGGGIVLFTVQHNFEHSYATSCETWCYDTAAIHGTSFLEFPRWLNWFTANIAYHHIHHLSAKIPNYHLAACHAEYRELFTHVRRIKLAGIASALKCILWDTRSQRIISVAEYRQQAGQLR
jgi:acyl-lipid omega-6 desaturase (Delta-12 desaturase)